MPTPFEKDFEQHGLRTLYRKMRKTAKSRFIASRRLERHQDFLAWSTSLFSVGLIALALMTAFQWPVAVSTKMSGFWQIALAILLLVVSLLLSGKNYQKRSMLMHRCGLEVDELCNSILDACRDDDVDAAIFTETREKYAAILSAYENHEKIDNDLFEAQNGKDYNLGAFKITVVHVRYWWGFALYLALLVGLVAVFVGFVMFPGVAAS